MRGIPGNGRGSRSFLAAAAALGVLALASAALAQGRPQARSRPSSRFDVTDFGAVAEWSVDSTSAFEAAAAAAAKSVRDGGRMGAAQIHVPGATQGFMITRPIHIPDGVDIVGDGWSSKVQMYPAHKHPIFVFGVDAVRAGPTDRPDLFGLLDASAAPARGARRGFSTAGGKFLQIQFHDIVHGRRQEVRGQTGYDYWEQTDRLTVDLGLAPLPGKPWKPWQPLVGLGLASGLVRAWPWFVTVGENADELVFFVADERFGDDYDDGAHRWVVSLKGHEPPYDLAFQVNLRDGRFAAFLGGRQVEAAASGTGPGYAARRFEPGHRLRANEDNALYVGADGPGPASTQYEPAPLTLLGLHVSATERYRVGRPGAPQTRVDGGTVDDRFRYFDRSPADATVGYLPFDDLKSAWTVDVADQNGSVGTALLMKPGQGGGEPNQIRDIRLFGRGPCVVLGAVLDFKATRLRAESTESVAIGSWRIVAAYPVALADCYLEGLDTPYYGFRQILWADRTQVHQLGRDGWRLRGCNAVIRTSFHGFLRTHTERIFTFLPDDYGGLYTIDTALVDSENGGVGTAIVDHWAHPNPTNQLLIDNLVVDGASQEGRPRIPIVKLHDRAQAGMFVGTRSVEIRHLSSRDDARAAVSVDGPGWVGSVHAPLFRGKLVEYTGPPGTASRVVESGAPR